MAASVKVEVNISEVILAIRGQSHLVQTTWYKWAIQICRRELYEGSKESQMPFCPQALLSRNSIRSNEIFSPTIRQKEGGGKLGRNLSSFIRQRHYLGLARLS